MSEKPFCAPGHRHTLSAREPIPGEPLWSVKNNTDRIDAELRHHGEFGAAEAQLLRDRELFIGRTFPTRELAVQWAGEERKALVADGWALVESTKTPA